MRTRMLLISVVLVQLAVVRPDISVAQQSPTLAVRVTKPLTNDDVLQMVNAKFADSTIIKAVQANPEDFDVSVPALVRLKAAGVSQAVIEVMLSAASNKTPAASGSPVPKIDVPVSKAGDLPEEVGVYAKQDGKLIAIEPEIVNWRSGGVVKTVATLGLDKGHVNGTVAGAHSSLPLKWSRLGLLGPLEFYIRCPEGNSASEYQLLRLWDKGNRREFRAVTGGVFHMTGGAEPNQVQFQFDKVGSRTYRVRVSNVEVGEYGFLAPGAVASSNAASLGKIYTFRIPE